MKQLIPAIAAATLAISLLPGITLAQEIPNTLRQGMSYAQARKSIRLDTAVRR